MVVPEVTNERAVKGFMLSGEDPVPVPPTIRNRLQLAIGSGIVANKNLLTDNPDLVKRFMRASTRAAEAAEKSPEAAVDAMLKANPKVGVRETLIIGMKQSVALYHTTETAKQRPFRVSMKNVSDTLDLLVQYGGMDPATRGKPEDYVTLEFLPAE